MAERNRSWPIQVLTVATKSQRYCVYLGSFRLTDAFNYFPSQSRTSSRAASTMQCFQSEFWCSNLPCMLELDTSYMPHCDCKINCLQRSSPKDC